jgi:uncharacterized repeat protein (TIGR03803 family)
VKSLEFIRYALSSYVAVALLAGCGGSQPGPTVLGTEALPSATSGKRTPDYTRATSQLSAPSIGSQTRPYSGNFRTLFSFDRTDGKTPDTRLADIDGTLYGTTHSGGASDAGTVFRITMSGKENVLYSFKGGTDGDGPLADLLDVNDTLYGTTAGGGASGHGTVFKIATSGTGYKSLYSFKGRKAEDGSFPGGGLVDVDGTLYGTTVNGGPGCPFSSLSYECGTIFKITTFGKETVLYSFGGGVDGALPEADLLNVNGTLYGTTASGGSSGCADPGGCGTVFKITTSGKETVLHSFGGRTDGSTPVAALLNVNGALYSTTETGGDPGCGTPCGTVFKITTSGKETVLYSFKGGSDGGSPVAGLANLKGTLYGTTVSGGGSGCADFSGCGTIFSITTSGKETVLHRFPKARVGIVAGPQSGLTDVKGTLYGTTSGGGAKAVGTVFSLSP